MPFQCNLCHFRNLTNRDSGKSAADVKLVVSIRRANLDAFWAREPGTVGSTRREGVKIRKLGDSMGLINLFPATGPFPLEDTMGMGIVVCMLQRSLDKGRYRDNLQFETVRNMRSTYLNIWYSSRQTLTTSIMARDIKKTYVTSCPTYGLWFERFVFGMHKRMGDEVYQDQAITLAVIHKLIEGLDIDFNQSKSIEEKEGIADQAVFVLAAFLAALRGEEVFKLVLGEDRDFLLEGRNIRVHPHVVLPLRGRFKGETGVTFHFVVVTARRNSGLAIGKWLERRITLRERRGVV